MTALPSIGERGILIITILLCLVFSAFTHARPCLILDRVPVKKSSSRLNKIEEIEVGKGGGEDSSYGWILSEEVLRFVVTGDDVGGARSRQMREQSMKLILMG